MAIRSVGLCLGMLVAVIWSQAARGVPIGTAMTYQGQLRSSGLPYAGTADLIFTLYDDPAAGGVQGGPIALTAISVVNGQFTVQLDFGAAAFAGGARWLDIQVRTPAGSGSYTTLSPRQALTAAPYALYALSGSGSGGGPWVVSGANVYYNSGNVGIGTSTPQTPLEVRGGAANSSTGTIMGTQTTGSTAAGGVFGQSLVAGGNGVVGMANVDDPNGTAIGVLGETTTANGAAVVGWTYSPSGPAKGVWGSSSSPDGYAGYFQGRGYFSGNVGIGTAAPQAELNVNGTSWFQGDTTPLPGAAGAGVAIGTASGNGYLFAFDYGAYQPKNLVLNSTGANVGIGTTAPNHRLRVSGGAAWTTAGWAGSLELDNAAAIGWHADPGGQRFGLGQSGGGLYFFRTASDPGTTGSPATYDMLISDSGSIGIGTTTPNVGKLQISAAGNGVYASTSGASAAAVWGEGSGATSFGVYGNSASLAGVFGNSTSGVGVRGHTASNVAVLASADAAATAIDAETVSGYGVYTHSSGTTGVNRTILSRNDSSAGIAIHGWAAATSGTSYGVYGQCDSPNGWAVFASGDMGATGLKPFVIDHPLDPENKTLKHFAAEGPEPQNIYNGIATTDAQGNAWASLPDYFEEINRDFRYQLTVIDDGADFVIAKVASEVQANRFLIRTSRPNVKVSWEVKGIRNDPGVRMRGFRAEEDKPDAQRGKYLVPEAYGLPKSRGFTFTTGDSPTRQPNSAPVQSQPQ